jgi:PAS domain S-box-containing protein
MEGSVNNEQAEPTRLDTGERAGSAQRIEMLERAEEIAGIGSYIWDLGSGRLQWSDNLYRLFGVEPGDVTPTPGYVLERVVDDDRDELREVIERAAETGVLSMIEYRIVRADGALRRLHAAVTSVQADTGVSRRLVGAVQDVTESGQVAREVAGHIAMEEVLAAWVTLEQGGGQLLASLGEATGFAVGALWLRRGDALLARACWAATSARYPFDSHQRLLLSQRTRALPVDAWLTQAPIVVVDLASAPPFAGRDTALGANLHGAVPSRPSATATSTASSSSTRTSACIPPARSRVRSAAWDTSWGFSSLVAAASCSRPS